MKIMKIELRFVEGGMGACYIFCSTIKIIVKGLNGIRRT